MTTINRLSSVDALQPGDLIPVWDTSNGDPRKASLGTLLGFIEANFADPEYSTRIVAPNVDGFNVDIGNTGDSFWLIVNPVLNYTTGSITLPSTAYAVNGQEITVVFTAQISSFSITGTGATVLGAPTQIGTYDSFRVRYNAAQQTWYTLDTTGDGSGGGTSSIVRQDFTGDGVVTTFALANAPAALGNELQVFIDGVYQERAGYSVSGNDLVFSEAPPVLSTIEVLAWGVNDIGATTANLVTYTPAGTGAVATTVQDKLRESVSVKDFGAVGDGVTDDTAAIQAAINSIPSGGVIYLPVGTYLTSGSININTAGVHFIGSGTTVGNVKILASHTNGPVIRVSKAGCKLSDFAVDATVTRQVAPAGTNYGIQYEANDLASQFITRQRCLDISVRNQPSHGVVVVGAVWYSEFTRIICDANGGHGFAIDDGVLTSRANKDAAIGFLSVSDLVSTDNGGHGFACGSEATVAQGVPTRVNVINYDSSGNATDAAVRYTAHDFYFFGENHHMDVSAIDCAVGAMMVKGRNIQINNIRLVGALTSGIEVNTHSVSSVDSRGVVINGIRSLATAPLNPAVNIAVAACIGTKVICTSLFNITTLVTDSGTDSVIESIKQPLIVDVPSGSNNITIRVDGVVRGYITTRAGLLAVGTGATRLLFNSGSSAISPEGDGAASNGLIDLGRSSTKFKDLWLGGYIYQSPRTLSLIPAAGTAGAGARAFISDASATTFASIASGGGANIVPVYSDGTNWRIG
jgi:hypothetical protein